MTEEMVAILILPVLAVLVIVLECGRVACGRIFRIHRPKRFPEPAQVHRKAD